MDGCISICNALISVYSLLSFIRTGRDLPLHDACENILSYLLLYFDIVVLCFLFTHSEIGGLKVLILHSVVIANHVEPARDFVLVMSIS